ncbi:MAG: MBL fold metallo-hydrolase [Verrucomicrobiaceae bacterium]|nr:MAG: MBL fold metallo-hydrolase [Verrucomicrobiaceae bacterium]
MFLRQITDSSLAQNAYLIGCQRTGEAIIVDPERDLDRYLQVAADNDLRITAVAETHIHADYLSGARELVERHGLIAYLSEEGGPDWQFEWAKRNPNARFLKHGDVFRVGNIELKALLTPGHTPEHLSFLVTDIGGGADEPMAFLTGDFIFVGDVGRPDLLESAAGQAGVMEPSARTLYASLRATANLPEHLQILPAHGAGSVCGKALGAVPGSVMGYERKFNAAFREALTEPEDQFVQHILSGQPEPPLYFARMKRDNKLGPALLPDGKLPAPKRVTADQLGDWIGKAAILDLRADRAAFAAAHLQSALFTPLPGGKLPVAAGSYVDEDASILLVVESETQVDEAVRQLIRIGLDHIDGWIPADEILTTSGFVVSYPRIAPADLPADANVLDVRGADEFAAKHVKGAKNIAYTRLAARFDEVPSASPLHVHCAGGMRAAIASAYLASRGREVVHLDGPLAEIPGERLS